MIPRLPATTCFFLYVVAPLAAEKEYVHTKDTHYPSEGEHNVEFDHEAILGSLDANDDFSKLSAHEAKMKLAVLLKAMDSDSDEYITTNEISDWVLASFRNQDGKEAEEKLKEIDADGDGQVSWAEYVKKVYGFSLSDIESFKKDRSPEMQDFIRMVTDDEEKFTLADQDGNGYLTLPEYTAFLFPSDYEYMHEHEIRRTLTDVDANNDGTISFKEYLGESQPGKEQMVVDWENFKTYDKNVDGHLDRDEIRVWTLPDRRAMADEEAVHLMRETDADGDGRLRYDEILDRHDLWVGSAATDYGQSLRHDASEL